MDSQPLRWRVLAGLLCILLLLGTQQPARAQTSNPPDGQSPSPEWQISADGERVTLTWQPDLTGPRVSTPWPLAEVNGLQLPARLFSFAAVGDGTPRLHIHNLTSQPTDQWESQPRPVVAAIPQTVDGTPRPGLALTTPALLPDTPVTLLRQGRMRGVDLLVVAVTQRFRQNAQPHTLTSLTFSIDGAQPLESYATIGYVNAAQADQPFALEAAPLPSRLTSQPRLRVAVQNAGMQEIRLADLRALGFVTDVTPLAHLSLYRKDQPVALEEAGALLRFYAPVPGDRWNQNDFYWLVVGSDAGLRMGSRPALSESGAALPITEQGWESGRWSQPVFYDSTLAGQDGDHWFAYDLRSGPELEPLTLTLPIPSLLPPLAVSAVFTLHTAGYTNGGHNLRIAASASAPTATLLAWAGSGVHAAPFQLDSRNQMIRVATVEGQPADGLLIDSLQWRRPVALRIGYTSAIFETDSSPARLHLAQIAAVARLYDITDPLRPARVLLDSPSPGSLLIESGGEERYLLLADENRLHLPLISGGGQNKRTQIVADGMDLHGSNLRKSVVSVKLEFGVVPPRMGAK